ncbi:MAG: patatin-like phospholipase family protein, partial [bacterium]|nr:patatin-like phospholipase family protein [bacterium]
MERALILSGGGARGAFHVGVLQYLEEKNWRPDLICGTSIGAINAVAVGSGLSAGEIAHIWKRFDRKKMFKITMAKFLRSLLNRRGFTPLMDTGPLKSMLMKYMDIDKLRKSEIKIIITAVNMATSRLEYFGNNKIDIDHVMAATAFPMVFPWHFIKKEPYWDGGVMDNTPIM